MQPGLGEPAAVLRAAARPRGGRARPGSARRRIRSLGEPWTKFCLQHADRILAVTAGGPGPAGAWRCIRSCRAATWSSYDAEPGALDGWAAVLDPIEVAPAPGDRVRRRHGPHGPPAGRPLGRDRPVRRRRPGVLAHRRARGADRRGRDDRPRRRGQHGRRSIGALFAMGLDADEIDALCFEEWVQRRPCSDYTIPRHSLIRGERVPVDAAPHLRRRRLIEELPRSFMCGMRRTAQRTSRDRAARAAVGGGRLQHVPADHRAAAGSRPRAAHRRFAGRQPSRAGDGRHRRGPDHRSGRQGDARAPARRPGGGTRTRRRGRRGRRACGETLTRVLLSAARTRPKRPAVTPTS